MISALCQLGYKELALSRQKRTVRHVALVVAEDVDNSVDGDQVVGVDEVADGGVVAVALRGAVGEASLGHVPGVVERVLLVEHLLGSAAHNGHTVLVEGSLGLVRIAHSHQAGQSGQRNNNVPHPLDGSEQ